MQDDVTENLLGDKVRNVQKVSLYMMEKKFNLLKVLSDQKRRTPSVINFEYNKRMGLRCTTANTTFSRMFH